MLAPINKYRWFFYSGWLLLLLIQAYFTELIDDEAYYWFYSRQLSWGYFDHPPMIALMIKAGYSLIQNELGVRIFSVLAGISSLIIIEKMLVQKNFLLYATLISTILISQLGGFIAVPDSPYLFFITLFIFQFKRYLGNTNWINGTILGLLAACILYSKYHGAMLLFFMVLVNLSLFRRWSFYLCIVIAFLAYLPHLIWLINNDYPSFYYHFGERNVPSYTIMSTIEYLLGQLAIYGPLTSFFIFYALFNFKGRSKFERTLNFASFSVLVFLFLFSFKGTIEANWSIAIFVPLLITTHQYLEANKRVRKIYYYTVPISLLIILSLRIFLIYDLSQGRLNLRVDFHHKRESSLQIQEKAGNLPVVFVNSYQQASLYSFYTHQQAISLNNIFGRMNQYNLSSLEDSLQGKKVFIVANWPSPETDSFYINNKLVRFGIIEHFSSFSKLYFHNRNPELSVKQGDNLRMKIQVDQRYTNRVIFDTTATYPSYITYYYFVQRKLVHEGNTGILVTKDILNKELSLDITTPPLPGTYYLRIAVSTGWLPPTFNSKKWKVVVN